jgi:hypothetical protein
MKHGRQLHTINRNNNDKNKKLQHKFNLSQHTSKIIAVVCRRVRKKQYTHLQDVEISTYHKKYFHSVNYLILYILLLCCIYLVKPDNF